MQWGGRFAAGPSVIMQDINASIGFDRKLWRQDIRGSRAHAAMLAKIGLLSADDEHAIAVGLDAIAAEIEAGRFAFDVALEDIHMNIEARLTERIGEAGKRLHTARSRNDQVATDFRLWVRDAIDGLTAQIADTMLGLAQRAAEHAADPMPGFTHLQTAQPVTFGHHMLAYVEMLDRDRGRLADCRRRLNACPLGSAALAGTSFPIDRGMTAAALGFDRPTANSLDAVSDRDFVAEALFDLALVAVHLSRIGEEWVLWTSEELGFARLDDAYATGSSMLPQKKNPDIAELARGKAGRVIGDLTGLLVTLKGLPLAYNRDLQEDKEPLFDGVDQVRLALVALTGMIASATFRTDRMQAAADEPVLAATDLAEWLVGRGTPFRDAHAIVGALVRRALEGEGSLAALVEADPALGPEAAALVAPGMAVGRRTTPGGAGPVPLGPQLERFRHVLASERERLLELAPRPA